MIQKNVPKRLPTVHDKKRQGLHHKTSRHYTKTYWPYLPMLLLMIVGTVLNFAWQPGKAVLGYATSIGPASLLQETNIQRGQSSQTALMLNNQLSAAAQAKANDMAARNYWSHVTPDGVQPWQFIQNAGYNYAAAAENLAYGFDTSAAAVAGWMNSPGHRANILNAQYREVGFGIANVANYQNEGEQTIVVAMYGQPSATAAQSSNGTAAISVRVGPAPTAAPTPASSPAPSAPVPSNTPAPSSPTETPAPTAPTNSATPPQTLRAREVARIDILTNGRIQWAALAVAVVAGLSICVFFIRHARLWHRLIVKGERFIIHHPILDTAFVAIGVIGFLLTRTSGFIH
jgi:hypothetical protein